MRILHLTRDYPPPGRGGISTAVAGLVAAAARRGIDAAILSLERGRGAAVRPLVRTVVGAHPIVRVRDPAHMEHACAALRPADFDVVHVHEPLWLPVVDLVAERAGLVVTPHVDHGHMAAVRGTGPPGLSFAAQRQLLARADIVAAPSAAAAARLCAGHPDIAARLVVVPHGIEPPPAVKGPAPAREPLVAYIGRFDEAKGTADFAAAIVPVLDKHRDAHVLIAGGLPANLRSERRWLRRWHDAWPADLAARIEVAGWLEPEELAGVYRRAAAVVIPSHYETFGLVALEAMASGAAVVATRAGGLAEIVRDGITGLLCAPGDRQALAAAIGRILADRSLRSRLGAAGAAAAARDHDWRQIVPRWIAAWERALAMRRRRCPGGPHHSA
jgi:glycosyltransferase involved in cell wall biosynthesis